MSVLDIGSLIYVRLAPPLSSPRWCAFKQTLYRFCALCCCVRVWLSESFIGMYIDIRIPRSWTRQRIYNAKVQISWPVISRGRSSLKVIADLFTLRKTVSCHFLFPPAPTAGYSICWSKSITVSCEVGIEAIVIIFCCPFELQSPT
jgi:hypothetical protein